MKVCKFWSSDSLKFHFKFFYFKVLAGLLIPESGTIQVLGSELSQVRPGPQIGYCPQKLSLHEDLTVVEILDFYKNVYMMEDEEYKKSKRSVFGLLGFKENDKRKVADLSSGEKRRVSIAIALIHNPPLLILDEPTIGIDPKSSFQISFFFPPPRFNFLFKTENRLVGTLEYFKGQGSDCDHHHSLHRGS